MKKYMSCVKYPNEEKYEIIVSLPNETYGITWFVVDDPIADKKKNGNGRKNHADLLFI